MAKLSIKPGSANVTLLVFIQDSTSTTGAGKTALAYDTASLTCYYARPGEASAALSLVTQTVTGAHSDGGFVKIDDTNMPGVYRLDLSDAVVAVGVRSAVVMLKGATGMAPLTLEIDLNAEVNVTHIGATAQTARDIGASVLLSSGTGTGQISLSSGAITVGTNNDKTGYTASTVSDKTGYSLAADQAVNVTKWGGTAVASAYVQANTAQFAGQTITCAGGVTIPAATLASTTGAVGSVTAAVTLTADYDAAKTAATQTSVNTIDDFLDTEVAAILAAVDTEVAAIKAKTDNLPASPAAVGSAMTLANDSITADAIAASGANEIADALLDRDMSVGSDSGSATVRTPRQALRFLRNKWGVVGTDLTVCKEDDTATSWTATITTSASAEPIIASDPASS